ncbi:MAG: Mrp/NBP35 family ATP-binding protein [Alphaproteobacteria bacterium]|nr:Mrp/NBP35 family ATP-binding protein [Alphaproteobacteria bacterium]
MEPEERAALQALARASTRVVDPVGGRSLQAEGMLLRPRVEEGTLCVELHLSRAHDDAQARALEQQLARALALEGLELPLRVQLVAAEAPLGSRPAGPVPPGGAPTQQRLPGVRRVVAVASGKGGVGKSTVAVNLAAALARGGLAVGLLDADVMGPSAPTMLGTRTRPIAGPDGRIVPARAHGITVMSLGLVVEQDMPVIWRGPMVMGAIRQLLHDTAWGALDVLVVDLPPGTGDAQLSLLENTVVDGVVLVTTPQEVALADLVRGVDLFQRLGVRLLGLVENMAGYRLPDGSVDPVFGEDGGTRTAARLGLDVLARFPLRTALRASGDAGVPAALGEGEDAETFRGLAETVAARLASAPGADAD